MNTILRYLKPLVYLFILRCVFLQVNASALPVDKASLPYEISSIQVSDTHMHISGWAFIAYKQHFDSSADHATQLEFVSLHHSFIFNAHLTYNSKTEIMTYFGSPTCPNSSINQPSETCNYRYEYTGFTASIPLTHFQSNQHYQTNLVVHGFTAGVSYKTPVFYPMQDDLVFLKNNHQYRFISKLDDTELRVNATTVIVRKQPSKTGEFWYYGSNCSSTYLNQLFFQKDTIYRDVYEKVMVVDISYYRLAAKLSICLSGRRRVVEGLSISPVWIASPYVLYNGSPLQIQVVPMNQKPYFVGSMIELYVYEPLVITHFIKAYDHEDGELTHKIQVLSTNYEDKVGLYQAHLSVVDSGGLVTQHLIQIHVLPLPNEKPMLFAYDKTLMQYTSFDPFANVSAYDKEDGDISHNISATNDIDTSQLGQHSLCYVVFDSQLERADKCITVTIVSYSEMINHFRFISKNYLFYQELVPSAWVDKVFILDNINFEVSALKQIRISDSK